MIRSCLKSHKLYGKVMFHPKYGNSFYEALDYTRVLSGAKPDPNDKYDVEQELWMASEQAPDRGGSEVHVNNPRIRPNIS